MRNDKYLKTLLKRSKGFVKRTACVGVASCMLAGGSLIAEAATLDDVFDAEQYADDYADLGAAFGYDREALLNHYKTYGILEGRKVSGLIDIAKYREQYPDLYAAFGDDWDAYVDHFLTFGILEAGIPALTSMCWHMRRDMRILRKLLAMISRHCISITRPLGRLREELPRQ